MEFSCNSFERRSSSPHVVNNRSQGHSRNASLGSIGGVGGGGGKSDLSEFSAEIIDIHLARENGAGKQFVNYVILVKRNDSKWQILRRYSDFFHIYQTITGQYLELVKIPFPGKKAFGNLERNVVEKRRKMLSEYLSAILALDSWQYPGLYEIIIRYEIIMMLAISRSVRDHLHFPITRLAVREQEQCRRTGCHSCLPGNLLLSNI